MPLGVKFKDSTGLIGRARTLPIYETEIRVRESAKSLSKIQSLLKCEIKETYLYMNFENSVTRKIKIGSKNAVEFANWILNSFANRKRKS